MRIYKFELRFSFHDVLCCYYDFLNLEMVQISNLNNSLILLCTYTFFYQNASEFEINILALEFTCTPIRPITPVLWCRTHKFLVHRSGRKK